MVLQGFHGDSINIPIFLLICIARSHGCTLHAYRCVFLRVCGNDWQPRQTKEEDLVWNFMVSLLGELFLSLQTHWVELASCHSLLFIHFATFNYSTVRRKARKEHTSAYFLMKCFLTVGCHVAAQHKRRLFKSETPEFSEADRHADKLSTPLDLFPPPKNDSLRSWINSSMD